MKTFKSVEEIIEFIKDSENIEKLDHGEVTLKDWIELDNSAEKYKKDYGQATNEKKALPRVDLPAKLKQGLKVRILAPNPDSLFVVQQDKADDKAGGSTAHDIKSLAEWVEQLKTCGDIELCFYSFRPQDFYFRQDNYVYTGPYLYGVDSQQTISFEYEYPSHGFEMYVRHFETVWEASGLTPQNENNITSQ